MARTGQRQLIRPQTKGIRRPDSISGSAWIIFDDDRG